MKTLLVCLMLATASSHGSSLFSQGPPNDNAIDFVDFRTADDFQLGNDAVITGISFWYQAQNQSDLISVAYAVYSDSGGALGGVLATGSAMPLTSVDGNAFLASFSIPGLALNAGSYWLELHGGANLTDTSGFTVDWANADDNATHLALFDPTPTSPVTSSNNSGFEQFAFELDGAETPEPATMSLMIIAAIFLVIRRRLRYPAALQYVDAQLSIADVCRSVLQRSRNRSGPGA